MESRGLVLELPSLREVLKLGAASIGAQVRLYCVVGQHQTHMVPPPLGQVLRVVEMQCWVVVPMGASTVHTLGGGMQQEMVPLVYPTRPTME